MFESDVLRAEGRADEKGHQGSEHKLETSGKLGCLVTLVMGHYRIREPYLIISSYLTNSSLSPSSAISSCSVSPGLYSHVSSYLSWRSGLLLG